jgi:DNA-3-methyladenine glycosylase II
MGVSKEVLEHLKRADSRLGKVIEEIGDLQINTYNPSSDELLFLIREIIGQMISSGVKKVIWQRLKDLCDNEVSSETLTNLTIEQLRSIGLSNAKSGYILNLANLVSDKTINFDYINSLDDEGVIKELTKIKGIGKWTSKMYLIFFLLREDVLPYEDGAFIQAYKWLYNTQKVTPDSISRKCKKWKPYQSIGARYMYQALDRGFTNIPVKEFLE